MTEIKIGTITDEKLAKAIDGAMQDNHASPPNYTVRHEKDGKMVLDVFVEIPDEHLWLWEVSKA